MARLVVREKYAIDGSRVTRFAAKLVTVKTARNACRTISTVWCVAVRGLVLVVQGLFPQQLYYCFRSTGALEEPSHTVHGCLCGDKKERVAPTQAYSLPSSLSNTAAAVGVIKLLNNNFRSLIQSVGAAKYSVIKKRLTKPCLSQEWKICVSLQ